MANNNENIHYTVSVDVKKAEADVNSLRESVDGLRESFEKSDKRKKESRELSKSLAAEEQKLEAAEINLAQALNATAGAHVNSTKAINDQIQALVRENSTIDMNSQKYRNNQKEIAKYANKMNQATGATGGVTSATMELSRVVSDAPYGIRGVANNLSQFTSQMYYASAAAGGLGKAFKQMWASLMGPLGVVLAITLAISALDFFAGSAKKAEEEAEGLDSALGSLAGKFLDLGLSEEETNKRLAEFIELQKLKTKIEGEKEKLTEKMLAAKEKEIDLEERVNKIKNSIETKSPAGKGLSAAAQKKAEKDLDKNQKRLELAKENTQSIYSEILKIDQEYIKAKDNILRGGKGTLLLLEQQLSDLEKQRTNISTTNKQYKELTKDIIATQKLIDEITGGEKKKGPKDPAFKAGKGMGSKEIDFTAENRKNNEAELLAMAIHESDKRQIRNDSEIEALEDKKDAFVKQRNQALENFVTTQELRKENNKGNLRIQEDADKLIFEAYRTANEDILDAEKKHGDALTELKNKQKEKERNAERKNSDLMKQLKLENREEEIAQESYDLTDNGLTVKKNMYDAEIALLQDKFDEQKRARDQYREKEIEWHQEDAELTRITTELKRAEAEKQMAIEQAKADQRNTLFDAIGSSFGSMSRLMKKGSDEAKAFALLEIATGTAKGFINGLEIAQKSAKTSPNPALAFPIFYATQVSSVLGAAARAKSVIQGGPASSPSTPNANAGGGVDSGFKPEFNIVGNSNQNQLAQSIGDQNNAPVRAYVVYEDVSEAEGIASGSEEAAGI